MFGESGYSAAAILTKQSYLQIAKDLFSEVDPASVIDLNSTAGLEALFWTFF